MAKNLASVINCKGNLYFNTIETKGQSYECKNEEEYVKQSLILIEDIRNAYDIEIENVFMGIRPNGMN